MDVELIDTFSKSQLVRSKGEYTVYVAEHVGFLEVAPLQSAASTDGASYE